MDLINIVGVTDLQQIISNDGVSAEAGYATLNRECMHLSALGGGEVHRSRVILGDTGGENTLVPLGFDEAANISADFSGEFLAIADHHNTRARIMTKNVGGQACRAYERLQMSRRHIDDDPVCAVSREERQTLTEPFDVFPFYFRVPVKFSVRSADESVEILSIDGSER